MNRSPGHQKWPEHRVREYPISESVRVSASGELIAESSQAVEVREDGQPERYYLPRQDVRMDKLRPSSTTTDCPFKGRASYFSIDLGGNVLEDAAWSYEAPYDEHAALRGHIAFGGEAPELRVKVGEAPPQAAP